MKTPKREDVDPIDEPVYDCMGGICDITNDWEPVHVAHARWKRKNRVARLKDKIARLTAENKWLSEERRKYIDFYFNTLHDLLQMQEVFTKKKRSRKEQK